MIMKRALPYLLAAYFYISVVTTICGFITVSRSKPCNWPGNRLSTAFPAFALGCWLGEPLKDTK